MSLIDYRMYIATSLIKHEGKNSSYIYGTNECMYRNKKCHVSKTKVAYLLRKFVLTVKDIFKIYKQKTEEFFLS